MSAMASEITGVSIVYWTVCSGGDQTPPPPTPPSWRAGSVGKGRESWTLRGVRGTTGNYAHGSWYCSEKTCPTHYSDVIMSVVASQITVVAIVCPTVRCRSKKTSKVCATSICEGNPPVTGGSPHKGPVTRKISPFDDVLMSRRIWYPRKYNPKLQNTANSFETLLICS